MRMSWFPSRRRRKEDRGVRSRSGSNREVAAYLLLEK